MSPTAELPPAVDVLVVGGGLAGLEVARHLDRAGADVLVVEAGPGEDRRHVNAAVKPARAEEMWTDVRTDEHYRRPWTSASGPHFGDGAGLRSRLGGRSLYWHGVLLPVEEWALREPWWPTAVIDDLTRSWRGGPALYDRVRAELLGPVAPVPAVDVGGFALVPPPRAVRFDPVEPERWSAYSPLEHWADDAARAVLACGTGVAGIEVRDGRARGAVLADGTRVGAERVVLAAGAVESTRLAVQALATTGAPPVLTGLVDHLVQGFNATVPADGLPEGRFFRYAPVAGESRSNLFVEGVPNSTGGVELEVWVTGEQVPSAAGEVRCAPDGPWPWPTEVRAGLSAEDTGVVRAQQDVLGAFWDALCAVQGRPGSALEFGADFLSPVRTLRQVRARLRHDGPGLTAPVTWASPLGTEDHEGGTLALGAVLDDRHELTAVPGLHAAGPATFPRQGAANPSLTTLALARRLAGVLAG
ncbi:FAD-dependent oxidoreductase [Saccharothrix obliqua]|uniref:FAD-dependent oxidoreductase n=1 Tax=Saccharothrix obliqua TaxID=2861747 RepID=UPI001C603E44|nr:FAD-dependent oxidoreductase [Saccharothrix obliqua]MBW4720415.1 FAD-binding protein [Saccharothrix obliqua]